MPIIQFLFTAHEPGLIVLAATICLVSSYACIGLTRHARRASGRMRNVWTAVAAMAVGFGIWATHFVAVLAFRPGFTLSYDIWLTALSLLEGLEDDRPIRLLGVRAEMVPPEGGY